MIGHTLQEAIQRVKGVAGVGSGYLPSVVTLVDILVDQPVVQPAVNPVYQAVGEHEKEKDARGAEEPAAHARDALVEPAVPADLEQKDGCSKENNERRGDGGVDNLAADLVREEERMLLEAVVEQKEVAESGEDKVDEVAAEQDDGVERERLSQETLLWPVRRVHVGSEEVAVAHIQDEIHGYRENPSSAASR